MAEFVESDELLVAAARARDAGFRRMDAYSPFPVEGLATALGVRHTRLPLVVLIGGILGGLAGYGLQYWVNLIEFPYNVGGRPYHSWPAFIPITFEMTILGASLAAVLGMLALNGLPMPYHPVFNVPEFNLASQHRFFLCIESRDRKFDLRETQAFLESLHPLKVTAVEW
jgi:ActD protein